VLKLYYHLRSKLLADVDRCFGKDSGIAVHEKKDLEMVRNEYMKKVGGIEKPFKIGDSTDERNRFVAGMNKLLNWADVSSLTEKELLWKSDGPLRKAHFSNVEDWSK
jgi:hypothetical protein